MVSQDLTYTESTHLHRAKGLMRSQGLAHVESTHNVNVKGVVRPHVLACRVKGFVRLLTLCFLCTRNLAW